MSGALFILRMRESGISNSIRIKVYVQEKHSILIDIIWFISYININDIFDEIGWYRSGVLNNRSFMNLNSNDNKKW